MWLIVVLVAGASASSVVVGPRRGEVTLRLPPHARVGDRVGARLRVDGGPLDGHSTWESVVLRISRHAALAPSRAFGLSSSAPQKKSPRAGDRTPELRRDELEVDDSIFALRARAVLARFSLDRGRPRVLRTYYDAVQAAARCVVRATATLNNGGDTFRATAAIRLVDQRRCKGAPSSALDVRLSKPRLREGERAVVRVTLPEVFEDDDSRRIFVVVVVVEVPLPGGLAPLIGTAANATMSLDATRGVVRLATTAPAPGQRALAFDVVATVAGAYGADPAHMIIGDPPASSHASYCAAEGLRVDVDPDDN